MRVAHFIQRYPPALGGSEDYFQRLSCYLTACGDAVTVWTTTALDLEAFWGPTGRRARPGTRMEQGVEVRRFPVRHAPLLHPYVFKALSLLPFGPVWQRLTLPFNPIVPEMLWAVSRNREPFDLVHAACFPYSGPLECARRLARRLRIPFVLTPFVHTGNPDDPRDRTRRAYTRPAFLNLARQADRVLVQTEGERQVLLAGGVRDEILIPQGLGLDRESCTGGDRARARYSWNALPDEVVIGHLANNSPEKGTVDLLRAARLAWGRGIRFRVVLAGPAVPSFRSFVRRYEPAGPLVRLGPLSEAQKKDFYAGIDVFVLPSRSDSFGLVLPESWANGVPCIVYRAGGPPWVVRAEQDGLIVPCGDIHALADALTRLVTDAELRHRLGQTGLERTRGSEFNWPTKLDLIRAVYQQLVAR
jgi:glycosyltransferase involved in cell wall biosynthesis